MESSAIKQTLILINQCEESEKLLNGVKTEEYSKFILVDADSERINPLVTRLEDIGKQVFVLKKVRELPTLTRNEETGYLNESFTIWSCK